MKRFFTCLLTILLYVIVHAQVEFENGWIIDNDGKRIECLIYNKGWRTSPKSFEYRILGDGKTIVGDIESISEFGTGNYHFIRKEVDVDTTRPSVDNYSKGAKPELIRMKVYLSVLCEGRYKLYSYKSGTYNDSFYYSVDDSEPVYLIHKHYIGTSGRIMENNAFRQQLIQATEGSFIEGLAIDNIKYNEKNLVSLFDKLNVNNRKKSKSWGSVKVNAFAGAGVVTSNFKNISTRPRQYFGPDYNVKAGGAELEYTFPYYRKKLSLVLSPEVYSFSQESYWEPIRVQPVKEWVKYSTINIPFGPEIQDVLQSKYSLIYGFRSRCRLSFQCRYKCYRVSIRKDKTQL